MEKIKITESDGVVATPKSKKRSKAKFIMSIIFIALIAGLAYSQYELYKLKDPTYQEKIAKAEFQKIVSKVEKIIVLPEGTPEIVVVQDIDKLRPLQPFFKDAENGDYVLVYTDLALIYSPSKNKIINVGPVTREEAPAPKATTTEEEEE